MLKDVVIGEYLGTVCGNCSSHLNDSSGTHIHPFHCSIIERLSIHVFGCWTIDPSRIITRYMHHRPTGSGRHLTLLRHPPSPPIETHIYAVLPDTHVCNLNGQSILGSGTARRTKKVQSHDSYRQQRNSHHSSIALIVFFAPSIPSLLQLIAIICAGWRTQILSATHPSRCMSLSVTICGTWN